MVLFVCLFCFFNGKNWTFSSPGKIWNGRKGAQTEHTAPYGSAGCSFLGSREHKIFLPVCNTPLQQRQALYVWLSYLWQPFSFLTLWIFSLSNADSISPNLQKHFGTASAQDYFINVEVPSFILFLHWYPEFMISVPLLSLLTHAVPWMGLFSLQFQWNTAVCYWHR